ncbi:hypothetical protein BVC71_15220 [Marivivens niveibacter]|uniref:SseB protein N-terminal domain-containing protein n=1 Tax=Marivivens niveibacter TaxID=1930667 RepID=A0A251WW14_9RHOB|nr:SseB family protein [Marivivens niveibacter]OUD08153.1 hypothetical protein BVC71_15220 [Marivivens niveibacter]
MTTEIDTAHAAMEAAPEDDAVRLRFYERLADSELFLLLASEPEADDDITPEVIEADGIQYVLVFDREERLADFAERAASYAAVSGRGLAQMLMGQNIGMGVNLGQASSILIPPAAIDWLMETLGNAPEEQMARPVEITAPKGLPETLLTGLDRKLASAAGLAKSAYLAGVTYDNGNKSHILTFIGATDGAEHALANAVAEALTFSGIDAGMLDVTFVPENSQFAERLKRVGIGFDLPEPEMQDDHVPGSNPGMDPNSPPKLR